MADKKYKAVVSRKLSSRYEDRFVIVDTETGEVLDDAQGYGYKSIRGAYAAFGYKSRDTSKDKEKAEKRKQIKAWCKQNKSFIKLMDQVSFEIMKGSWEPDDKFNTALVKKLLKDSGYENLPFTAYELLQFWRKGK